jgi:hypothetical protein
MRFELLLRALANAKAGRQIILRARFCRKISFPNVSTTNLTKSDDSLLILHFDFRWNFFIISFMQKEML